MRKNILFFFIILFPFFASAQEKFRSGKFLHHSTGLDIWGPNGSSTSITQQMEIYNSAHGYSGSDAVSMGEVWWPSGGNNEWEYWNRIFLGDGSVPSISSLMNNNKILVIKSCFPSSEVIGIGQPSDTLIPTRKTIYNYKWIWRNIINIMAQRPQNFFAIWTNAPLVAGETNASEAALAKEFCTWAKDTLAVGLDPEMGNFPPNVYVFDFFSKLTDENGFLKLEYAENSGDSHPNSAATEVVAPQFVNEIFGAAIAYEGGGSTLTISPQSRDVSPIAGSTTFTVSSTTSWTAQSNASWCTVTASGNGSGTLTANYAQNTTGSSRTATITVSAAGAGSQTVTIIQSAASTLGISPQSQSVGYQQGNTSFSISSNTNWTAQSDASWCTVTSSGIGNSTLVANYTQNTSTTSRTAHISVSANGATTQNVTLVQAGAAAALAISPQSQSVSAPQGNTSFSITSNTSWTAQSDATWCTVTPSGSGNGELVANYSQNTSSNSRTANISVSANGVSTQIVSVVQAGAAASLAVSPQSQNVSALQGNTSFSITSNTNWTAQSDATWCTATPSGIGNSTLVANYTQNTSTTSRTAHITVSANGATTQNVTVVQTGAVATLAVSPQSQNVNSLPGSTNFNILSNTNWTAQSDATWCTVTSAGSGNGTITSNYTENQQVYTRTASIVISVAGGPSQTVTVIQDGTAAILSISPQSQLVGSGQGAINYAVTSNTEWTAQSDANWCIVTPNGNGTGQLVATYEENPFGNNRMANITIIIEGIPSQTVTLEQAGTSATLAVNPTIQHVGSQQGSANFNITSNTNWTAQSDVAWCTVTPSGSGNGLLIATFPENYSGDERTANIIVQASGTPTQAVTVIQAATAAILSVSPQQQNVVAQQGTANFYITSNTNWTATSNATWCTPTTAGNGSGALTADYSQNNSINPRIASITVYAENADPITVTVTQAGATATLSVSPEYQNVSALQGNSIFIVSSNAPWNTSTNANWCVITPSGTGNGVLYASYDENTSIVPRTAAIIITAGGTNVQTVNLTQSGSAATLTLSPPTHFVESPAGSASYTVTSNALWSAESDQEWCRPASSGNGNGTLAVDYDENTTNADRTAIITVSAEGAGDFQVSLVQKGLLTSIETPVMESSFKIYPNPSKGLLTIETRDELKGDLEINIINTVGEKIDFQTSRVNRSTFHLKLNTASTGIHLISITNGKRVLTQKFILY